MVIEIRASGQSDEKNKVLGRIACSDVEFSERNRFIRVVSQQSDSSTLSFKGYRAVLFENEAPVEIDCPFIQRLDDLNFLLDGYVVSLDFSLGAVRVLYRPDSSHNALFATDECNSHCIMCSQPSHPSDNEKMSRELLELIELIPDTPKHLGISGGEPTLLKDGLLDVITLLKEHFPETVSTMLSNGRMYAYEQFVKKLAEIKHPYFLTSIPLYSSHAHIHDYIVQAKGAFDQTIQGLYNAAKYGLAVELRIVLHKQTISESLELPQYIYRNLPFVTSIIFMGLENMGYVKKNWNLLWIDPVDYMETLEKTIRYLHYRKINTSIYNIPLCLLPKSLWSFARKSISDFKNIYLPECTGCSVIENCCGLFQSSKNRHSRGILKIIT